MPHCQNCGAFVTADFVRVFGGPDHELFGCLECRAVTELADGEAARGKP